jgi:hypothetical protein
LPRFGEEFACAEHTSDRAASRPDRLQFSVAPQAKPWVRVDTGRAVQAPLRLGRQLHLLLASHADGRRSVLAQVRATAYTPARQASSRLQASASLPRLRWISPSGGSPCRPTLHAGQHAFEAGRHPAERVGGWHRSFVAEAALRHSPAAELAGHMPGAHLAVLEALAVNASRACRAGPASSLVR